jgi:hypothetical protein
MPSMAPMNQLTENHLSFQCPMQWDAMAASPHGRFCGKCRKEVFDLSNCSIDEVIALQRKHGSICGSIRVATVAVSLATAACQNGLNTSATASVPGCDHYPSDVATKGNIEALRSGDEGIIRNSISGAPFPPEQLEKMKQPERR